MYGAEGQGLEFPLGQPAIETLNLTVNGYLF